MEERRKRLELLRSESFSDTEVVDERLSRLKERLDSFVNLLKGLHLRKSTYCEENQNTKSDSRLN